MGVVAIPGRVIFNNCVLFVAEIRKLIGKKNLTDSELATVKKAAVIAALSSNHSWKTYKYMHNYADLDKQALSEEFQYALKEGWKRITENDVEEVINGDFNPYSLNMWFYHAMGDSSRDEYGKIYGKMQKELAYGLEPIEKQI